jgi:Glycosyltransferase sugar-binding region containing DXD motif
LSFSVTISGQSSQNRITHLVHFDRTDNYSFGAPYLEKRVTYTRVVFKPQRLKSDKDCSPSVGARAIAITAKNCACSPSICEMNQPMGSNRIIQGLWVGSDLSTMEQLSIASFLYHGHEYHLYAYDELENVPAGTILKDAREILPESAIFQYRDRPTYAAFSNFFRYKLLLQRGGWWVDTDTVCLRPFDFSDEYVFSSEMRGDVEAVNAGLIKVPPASDAMAYAWRVCESKDPKSLVWGEIGPRLVAEVVNKFQLQKFKKPYYTFCPIDFVDWQKLLTPYLAGIPDGAYAIHLWNEMWRLGEKDKNAVYHRACIYEQLKATYLS